MITLASTITRICGPTEKQSIRSQFRKAHIQIYLYIYQLAASGTWSDAVNSSGGDRAFSEASSMNALPQALNLNRNLITLHPKRKTHSFDAATIYANNCKRVNTATHIFASPAPMDLILSGDGPVQGRICPIPKYRGCA